jgi:hypothetical protein
VITSSIGGIDILAAGAAAGEDIDIIATGSSVNIEGTEADGSAITIKASDAAGGVVAECGTGGMSLGANATAHTTTLGSTNTSSATVIQSGTGKTTMTGTVKTVTADHLVWTGDDITFGSSPGIISALNDASNGTGADGDVNILTCQQGLNLEQFIIGTQTIIKPVMDANGLLISLDLTAGEGCELNYGGALTNSRNAFVAKTSPAFFFEVELYVADVSGGAPYMIGFRKAAANNKVLADYTDYYCIGINTVTSATNVSILDDLNGVGQTATDTTDSWGGDTTAVTLRVLVSSTGVVTATINGAAPSTPRAFTFDADTIVPFVHILHGAAAPGAVNLVNWRCGFQA